MRKVLLGSAFVAAALAGCSKPAEPARDSRSPGAPPSASTANVARMLDAKRREGLWQMAMSTSAGPGMRFNVKVCVDKTIAGDFNVKGPGMGDCTASKLRPGAGGFTFDSVCKKDGRTITTTGVVTGDVANKYHVDASTTMDPPPPGIAAVQKTTIDAEWQGPCPAGMKPGEAKVGGMNLGG
jgi:uncharacterized protein DUF3617